MVPPAVRSITASTEMVPAPVCAECGGYVGTDVTRYMVYTIEHESELHIGVSNKSYARYRSMGYNQYFVTEATRMNDLDVEIISNALKTHELSGKRYYIDVIVSIENCLPTRIVRDLLKLINESKHVLMVALEGPSFDGQFAASAFFEWLATEPKTIFLRILELRDFVSVEFSRETIDAMQRAFGKLGNLPKLDTLSFVTFDRGNYDARTFPSGNDIAKITELKRFTVGLPGGYAVAFAPYLHGLIDGLLRLEHLTDVAFSWSPMMGSSAREVARFIQSSTTLTRVSLYTTSMDVDVLAAAVQNANIALSEVNVRANRESDRDRIAAAFAEAKKRYGIASLLAFGSGATSRTPTRHLVDNDGDTAVRNRVSRFLWEEDAARSVRMREGDE